jgi:soluble lytic murein transglycosylase-like protein
MKLSADECETQRPDGPPKTRHRARAAGRVCCVLAALAAASLALAQPCRGPLPSAAPASAVAAGEKFRLIAQQCGVLAEPAQVHRAAQLELYERGASVTIAMSAAASAPGDGSADASPAGVAPLSGNASRVLSLAPALTAAAQAHGIDPLLLHAIAHVESRHNAAAVSRAGARGVMQVMPATARRFGVDDPERALFNAGTNLRASAAYLRSLRARYGDDLRLVLAAYNAGEGAVDKHGGSVPPYPETQAYVRDVLAVYRRLTAEFAVSDSGTLVARRGRASS